MNTSARNPFMPMCPGAPAKKTTKNMLNLAEAREFAQTSYSYAMHNLDFVSQEIRKGFEISANIKSLKENQSDANISCINRIVNATGSKRHSDDIYPADMNYKPKPWDAPKRSKLNSELNIVNPVSLPDLMGL